MTTQLRRARERAGLSAGEVARRIGMTSGAMSLLENGRAGASAATLLAYAETVGGDLKALADALRPVVADFPAPGRRNGPTARQAAR